MDNFIISESLKKCREKTGLNPTAFSRRIGIPCTSLDRYEKGVLPLAFLDTLEKYRQSCNVTWGFLLFGTDNSIDDEALMQKFKKLPSQQKRHIEQIIDDLLNDTKNGEF